MMHRSLHSSVLLLSGTAVLSWFGMLACYAPREVGDSRNTSGSQARGVGGEPHGSEGHPDGIGGSPLGTGGQAEFSGAGGYVYADNSNCGPSDDRTVYEEWRSGENYLGEISGEWQFGDAIRIRFVIESPHVGYFHVGLEEYVEPVQGQGYLTPPEDTFYDSYNSRFPWVYAARYYIHSARLEGGILRATLPVTSSHDDWCRMQLPQTAISRFWSAGEIEKCGFSPYPEPEDETRCIANGEQVDCWWLRVLRSGVCQCDVLGCFQSRAFLAHTFEIDFRNPDAQVLTLVGPSPPPQVPPQPFEPVTEIYYLGRLD